MSLFHPPVPPLGSAAATVVAVIDSGISPDRLNLIDAVLPGLDLSGEGDCRGTSDEAMHGTAVAATIIRYAPNAKLVPVKIMNHRGVLSAPNLIETAFDWIIEHRAALGIGVICAAFVDSSHHATDERFRDTTLQRQIAALRDAGVLTVTAAGNYPEHLGRSLYGMTWPAILRETVSVGALHKQEEGVRFASASQRLPFSSDTCCGTTVFTVPGDPGETSGAAAVIAGCFAALRPLFPQASVTALVDRLLSARREVRDEHGMVWPTVDPGDLLEANWHGQI
ncbi:S8 family peptidase [Paenibacillus tyrfis]|uniref:S8 family peptidase n=1 Tax=Paenibacillus tyrfis TaxID=1501230 RepID=UPI0015C658A3|nr:S8 family serine peptidase [Paenibacillus tyrfis]